jgi:DNA primase
VATAAHSAPAPSDFARTLKDQADIVKIIGEYVRLEKAGAQNYRGLCPFHKEKTPSFSVHATQRFYHCFGCHESGDVFTFIQKIENCTFPEALRTVAQKVGVPMPQRTFSSPDEARHARDRGALLDIHEAAAKWFEQQLQTPEGARAREYLTSRDVSAQSIAAFRIGYAPESFNALRDLLRPQWDEQLLRASGLFSSKQQDDGTAGANYYSRFRKRITFPIRNEQGRTIAFTARALDSDEKSGPKYLNSPETPLYTKGHVLFNLDLAKSAIRQYDFALLVEGQMDAIRVHSANIRNVLATSGTAFTEHQVRLLSRFTRKAVVNFDPDTAGANAAEKSISLLIEEGFEVKVLTLPDGLDPDRFIRERGAPAYIAALRTALRHTDYLIDRARKLFPPTSGVNKARAVDFLIPHLRRIPNPVIKREAAREAAAQLGVDSSAFTEQIKQQLGLRRNAAAAAPAIPPTAKAEQILLWAATQPSDSTARHALRHALAESPALLDALNDPAIISSLAAPEQTPHITEIGLSPAQLAASAAVLHQLDVQNEDLTDAHVAEALCVLEIELLARRRRRLLAEMSTAVRESNGDRESAIDAELSTIAARIRTLER